MRLHLGRSRIGQSASSAERSDHGRYIPVHARIHGKSRKQHTTAIRPAYCSDVYRRTSDGPEIWALEMRTLLYRQTACNHLWHLVEKTKWDFICVIDGKVLQLRNLVHGHNHRVCDFTQDLVIVHVTSLDDTVLNLNEKLGLTRPTTTYTSNNRWR